MIKISDYTSLDNQQTFSTSFKSIKYLYQTNSQQTLTFQSEDNKIYYVQCFDNQKQAAIINELYKKHIFGNIIAVLKHKKLLKFDNNYKFKYICIFIPTISQTLQDYIEKNISQYKNNMLDQQYCVTFIERMIQIFQEIQENSILKVISPKHIIIRAKDIKYSQKNSSSIFYLTYPLSHNLLVNDQKTVDSFKKYEYYCAPQILNNLKKQNLSNNNSFDYSRQFPKAILYSLGLILLECFNFKISLEDRYKSLKNERYLKMQLKALRKQIKIFHQGKYVSKLLKLLLQGNEALRDNTQIFQIKMHSYQFKTLMKAKKNTNASFQSNATTLYNELQGAHGSQRPVIDIRLTTLSNNHSNSFNKSNSSYADSPSIQLSRLVKQQQQIKEANDQNLSNSNEKNQIISDFNQKYDSRKENSQVDIQIDWDEQSVINSQKHKKSKPNSNESVGKSNSNQNQTKSLKQKSGSNDNSNQGEQKQPIKQKKNKKQQEKIKSSQDLQFSTNSHFDIKINTATNLSTKLSSNILSQLQTSHKQKLTKTQLGKVNKNITNNSEPDEIYTPNQKYLIQLIKQDSQQQQKSQLPEQSSGIIFKNQKNMKTQQIANFQSDSQVSSNCSNDDKDKIEDESKNQDKFESFKQQSNSESQNSSHVQQKQIQICLKEVDNQQQVYNYFQDEKSFQSPKRKSILNKKESEEFFTLGQDFKQNVSLNVTQSKQYKMSHSSILKKDQFHKKSKAISLCLTLIFGIYSFMSWYIK